MASKNVLLTEEDFVNHLNKISCLRDDENLSEIDSLVDPEYCPPSVQKEGNEEDIDDDNCAIEAEN